MKQANLKNTRYRKRIVSLDGKTTFDVPRYISENEDWIKIEDKEEYMALFPEYTHNIMDLYWKEYAVYIHKTDIAFVTGAYDDLKKAIIDHFGEELKLYLYDKDIPKKSLNFFTLKDIVEQKYKCTIDYNAIDATIKVQKIDDVEAQIKIMTRDTLRNELRKAKLPQSGTVAEMKIRLIEHFRGVKNGTNS